MSLKMWIGVAVVLACGVLNVSGASGLSVADQSLMNYLMRSSMRDSSDPLACFTHFLPILSDLGTEFEKAYLQCSKTEEELRSKLNEDALSDRYQIELAADGVCTRLDACNSLTLALDYYDCVAGQGSENSRILYDATQNSSVLAADLREQYRIATVERIKCQNATERAYVEQSALTYSELDTCLKTGYIPPSASTPDPSGDTTTEQPEASSPGSSTETTSTTEETTTEDTTEDTTTTEPPPQEELPGFRSLRVLSHLRKQRALL